MKHFIKIKEGLKYFHILILTRYLIIRYNNTSWILNDDWERNIARRAKIAKRRGCFYQMEKDSIGKYTWNHRVGQSGMDAIYLYHLWASSPSLFATDSSTSLYGFGTSHYSITSGHQCKNKTRLCSEGERCINNNNARWTHSEWVGRAWNT